MIIGKTEFISDLYKDKPFYILEEYDKKYRFKIHSGRVGGEINNKHLKELLKLGINYFAIEMNNIELLQYLIENNFIPLTKEQCEKYSTLL